MRYNAEQSQLLVTTADALTRGTLEVMDLQGRILSTVRVTSTTTGIGTEAWPKGCYLVNVRDGSGASMSTKVVLY